MIKCTIHKDCEIAYEGIYELHLPSKGALSYDVHKDDYPFVFNAGAIFPKVEKELTFDEDFLKFTTMKLPNNDIY